MRRFRPYDLNRDVWLGLVRDYFAAFFGPLGVVLAIFSAKKLFEYFHPYVSTGGIDMIAYLWLHNINLFFILGFGGVLFLRLLSFVRKYIKLPWNLITPPFEGSIRSSKTEVNSRTMKLAKISSGSGFAIGVYFTLLLQFIGFVPYRNGMVLTGPLGKSAPSVSLPSVISELPVLSDLIVLGKFVASPHTFGYILISIALSPIIVAFWNLIYIFFNYHNLGENGHERPTWTLILFKWLPYFGVLILVVVTWKFGVFWFLQ